MKKINSAGEGHQGMENCEAQAWSPKSKVPKSRPKGLGLTLKSHRPPPTWPGVQKD